MLKRDCFRLQHSVFRVALPVRYSPVALIAVSIVAGILL